MNIMSIKKDNTGIDIWRIILVDKRNLGDDEQSRNEEHDIHQTKDSNSCPSLNRSVQSADNSFSMVCTPPQHRNHTLFQYHWVHSQVQYVIILHLLKPTYKTQIQKIISFDMHISVRRCFRIQVKDGNSMYTKGKPRKEQQEIGLQKCHKRPM